MDAISKQETLISPIVDIQTVQIDDALSQEERIRSFIKQIKNPYRFKVGDVIVNVSYSGENATLNDRFVEMLSLLT